jgi:DNA-directed RNA polymerase specialized sigma54-like protein
MAIQQKLHTKLVQKLILTPSLQQAIKLLPMSTLELSELLNQEMVENPLLEEVPGEDLQGTDASQAAAERAAEQEKRLRLFLRRLPRRRVPTAGAAGNPRAAAHREHAFDRELTLRPPRVAALAADRRPPDP